MHRAANAYLHTKVSTTSQGDIVIMLYDGAIRFLEVAKERLAANDMAGKGIYISKTLDILNELDSTLNVEKGGELAGNLHSLYTFCTNRLLSANIKKSIPMIDEVLAILANLRSAFAAIVELPEAQEAARQAAANQHADSILPMRQQNTAKSVGTPGVPMPGAGARMRNLYAQGATQQSPDQTGAGTQPASNLSQAMPFMQNAALLSANNTLPQNDMTMLASMEQSLPPANAMPLQEEFLTAAQAVAQAGLTAMPVTHPEGHETEPILPTEETLEKEIPAESAMPPLATGFGNTRMHPGALRRYSQR